MNYNANQMRNNVDKILEEEFNVIHQWYELKADSNRRCKLHIVYVDTE